MGGGRGSADLHQEVITGSSTDGQRLCSTGLALEHDRTEQRQIGVACALHITHVVNFWLQVQRRMAKVTLLSASNGPNYYNTVLASVGKM